jgi:hypothetical protein
MISSSYRALLYAYIIGHVNFRKQVAWQAMLLIRSVEQGMTRSTFSLYGLLTLRLNFRVTATPKWSAGNAGSTLHC